MDTHNALRLAASKSRPIVRIESVYSAHMWLKPRLCSRCCRALTVLCSALSRFTRAARAKKRASERTRAPLAAARPSLI